jgi:hypothetical protein
MKTSMLSVFYPIQTWSGNYAVVCPILSDDDDDGNSDDEGIAAHPLMSAIQNFGENGEVQHNMPAQVSRVHTTSGTYD